MGQLRLGDEDALVLRREGDDIQISQVVGVHNTAVRKCPLDAHRDAHPAHHASGKLVQPLRPKLAGRGALHRISSNAPYAKIAASLQKSADSDLQNRTKSQVPSRAQQSCELYGHSLS